MEENTTCNEGNNEGMNEGNISSGSIMVAVR